MSVSAPYPCSSGWEKSNWAPGLGLVARYYQSYYGHLSNVSEWVLFAAFIDGEYVYGEKPNTVVPTIWGQIKRLYSE